jgi:hypothetical protein
MIANPFLKNLQPAASACPLSVRLPFGSCASLGKAIDALPARLERAHKTGCSSLHGETLEQCIVCNRAGPDESEVPAAEFIKRWLTLPVPAADAGAGELVSG